MLHKISDFCNKIDSIKKMSDELRVLKYNNPKTPDRDHKVQNLIDTIQADCLLVSADKSNYNENEDKDNYGDYSGIDHDSLLNEQWTK